MMDRSWTLQSGASSDDGGRKSLQAEMRRGLPVRTDECRRVEMRRTVLTAYCRSPMDRRRSIGEFSVWRYLLEEQSTLQHSPSAYVFTAHAFLTG